ncbi:MAG TPA: hypothetical protein VG755_36955 [Nannocystaceae bacterium]|nr:hypothetical protein [Nannocystaceae bacterium]
MTRAGCSAIVMMILGCGDRSPPALWPEPPPPTLARPIGVDLDAKKESAPDLAEPADPDAAVGDSDAPAEPVTPDAKTVEPEPSPTDTNAAAETKADATAPTKPKRKPSD